MRALPSRIFGSEVIGDVGVAALVEGEVAEGDAGGYNWLTALCRLSMIPVMMTGHRLTE